MSEEGAQPGTSPDPNAKHYVTYKDRVGIMHVADSLDDVPVEYRDAARVIVVSGQGGDTPVDKMGDAVDSLVSGGRKTFDSVLSPGTEATTEAGLHLPSLGAGIGVGLAAGMLLAQFVVRGRPRIFLGILSTSVVLGGMAYFVGSFLHKNAARHALAQTTTGQANPPGSVTAGPETEAEAGSMMVPAVDAPSVPEAARDAAESTTAKPPTRTNKKRGKKRRKRRR